MNIRRRGGEGQLFRLHLCADSEGRHTQPQRNPSIHPSSQAAVGSPDPYAEAAAGVAAAVRTFLTGIEEPEERKPFLNFLFTRFRWRRRPVPVVLRRIAFSLQLSVAGFSGVGRTG